MKDFIIYDWSDGKTIRHTKIPKDFIIKNMRALDITPQQAIELYLSDEGYAVDPTVIELTDKANGNKSKARVVSKHSQHRTPHRKPLYEKRAIINLLYDALINTDDLSVIQEDSDESILVSRPHDVQITNKERIITFALGEDNYEIMLTKKRS